MDLTLDSAFTGGGLVGNLSYLLLIASMAMRNILWLRILAIFSGIFGVAYDAIWLHDPVGTFWESSFTLVNLFQWAWLTYENRMKQLTPEEISLRERVFPALSVLDFRRLLDCGRSDDFRPGDALVLQGDPVRELFLILDGDAEIRNDGHPVSRCVPGDFVDEIGFFKEMPASATVAAGSSLRCMVFPVEAVRQLMARSHTLERGLNVALGSNLATKLIRNNETGFAV
ncbi:MAG: cyclic nucleotide-binding domain-containing protein [bacterium]|nr:cyclic nucleotide-binding domain-containing protein [bacterium]